MSVKALQERTKLAPYALRSLLGWLQRKYLVQVVSSLEEDKVAENIQLTELGEMVLVGMLERTCELPELHQVNAEPILEFQAQVRPIGALQRSGRWRSPRCQTRTQRSV